MLAEWERQQLSRIERGLRFDYPLSTRRWARLYSSQPPRTSKPLGARVPWAWLVVLVVIAGAGATELVLALLVRDYLTAVGTVVGCVIPVAYSVSHRRTSGGKVPARRRTTELW